MRKIIATSKPVAHGDKKLAKSKESLAKLLDMDSLDIVNEHDGSVIGKARNFMMRIRNGITEILADIPPAIQTMNRGFSLQFDGVLEQDQINILGFHHLAITDNPRDVLTFSESNDKEIKGSEVSQDDTESKDDEPTAKDEPTDSKDSDEPESEPVELTIDLILDLLSTDEAKARLLEALGLSEQPGQPEQPEQLENKKPTRTFIKPKIVKPEPKKQSKQSLKVRQLSFPSL